LRPTTQKADHHPHKVGFSPGMQGWFPIQESINVMYHMKRVKKSQNLKILSDFFFIKGNSMSLNLKVWKDIYEKPSDNIILYDKRVEIL
jgi:hypothetical protein